MVCYEPNNKLIKYLHKESYDKVIVMLQIPYEPKYATEYVCVYDHVKQKYLQTKQHLIDYTKNNQLSGSRSRYFTRYTKHCVCNYDNYFFRKNTLLYNIYEMIIKKLNKYSYEKQIIKHDLSNLLPMDICNYIMTFY
jgi:hypothetical protein